MAFLFSIFYTILFYNGVFVPLFIEQFFSDYILFYSVFSFFNVFILFKLTWKVSFCALREKEKEKKGKLRELCNFCEILSTYKIASLFLYSYYKFIVFVVLFLFFKTVLVSFVCFQELLWETLKFFCLPFQSKYYVYNLCCL